MYQVGSDIVSILSVISVKNMQLTDFLSYGEARNQAGSQEFPPKGRGYLDTK